MKPNHVTVYGNDHPPWVQAVLLGLYDRDREWFRTLSARESQRWEFRSVASADHRTQAMEIFDTKGTTSMDTPRFMLCSLMACGTGINLTRANVVFMMDCWWNAAAESQAMDRIHRIGQSRPCRIYRFLMAGSIETRSTCTRL